MTDEGSEGQARQWRVEPWPSLAWLQMGIKLAGIVIGLVALEQALAAGRFGLPADLRLVQLGALVARSMGLLAILWDRCIEREVVSLIFVLLNTLGHAGMIVSLVGRPGPSWLLLAFALLMLAGEAVNLVYLRTHEVSLRNTPRAALFGLVSFYVVCYLVVLLTELMYIFDSLP
jgi:hypothetical protein